jgi:hypothetical protein
VTSRTRTVRTHKLQLPLQVAALALVSFNLVKWS